MKTTISPLNSNTLPYSNLPSIGYRPLEWWEIQQLERQGCYASDWSAQLIAEGSDLSLLNHVEFEGSNRLGLLDSERFPGCGLRRVLISDTVIGHGARIRNVGGGIINCSIADEVVIENTERIQMEPEAACGVGTTVNVLDETGSRPVIIYPGLSAQVASMMARKPRKAESDIIPQTETYIESLPEAPSIGHKAVIKDCGTLFNVRVGNEVRIEGARRLVNGSIINNAAPGKCLAFIGNGVDAENFIIEDGIVDSGTLLRNCYVGQGASLEKGFTAHDSLFFANCSLENGEACALFAGPYTVSMHKGTLLIGCQTSFMNAGSSTNQSNHMYKLGPVHWGVLERGVKTSSNSYLMLGALIGAFSLLMGQHKTHPDSSEFPFSYLFGDAQGATVVVPGMMLRSCGLLRDEKKWPNRDRRLKRKLPLNDRITFEVLNPYTVARILTALETIDNLLQRPADDDRYIRYKGMKISRASLERAKKLYSLAIYKYLYQKIIDKEIPHLTVEEAESKGEIWVDLAGQLMPRHIMQQALDAESVEEREETLNKVFEDYDSLELEWIAAAIPAEYLRDPEKIKEGNAAFDAIVEEDRTGYRDSLSAEQLMLKL